MKRVPHSNPVHTLRPIRGRRHQLDARLHAYSTAGKAAVVAAGATALGLASSATAQIVNLTQFNINGGGFGSTLPSASFPSGADGHLAVLGATSHGATRLNVSFYGRHNNNSATIPFISVIHSHSAQVHDKFTNGGVQIRGRAGHSSGPEHFITAQAIKPLFADRVLTHNGVLEYNRSFRRSIGTRVSSTRRGSGNWLGGNSGYLVFKSGSYYGWLHLKVEAPADGSKATITFVPNGAGVVGAVENINSADIASFHIGDVYAVPEPASVPSGLALFALGAVGVRELRRRRRQAAGDRQDV
ncbi:MAG TPA: hypothetical protein VHE13_10280 [Opitutus sp.]|nr:hypothetical protein [Opitutus sp.]